MLIGLDFGQADHCVMVEINSKKNLKKKFEKKFEKKNFLEIFW